MTASFFHAPPSALVEGAVGILVHTEGEVALRLVDFRERAPGLERDGVLEDHVLAIDTPCFVVMT